MAEKPVMYLDVDGVLWVVVNPEGGTLWTPENGYDAPPGLAEFMEFALANYEVRWCTAWATSGKMDRTGQETLAKWTGVPVSVWERVKPSLGWIDVKTACIDWSEVDAGRTFIWIEDGILPEERQVLRGRGIEHWYIHTDVLEDPDALLNTLAELHKRLGDPRATPNTGTSVPNEGSK